MDKSQYLDVMGKSTLVKYKLAALFIAFLLVIGAAYYVITPKVIVSNLSDTQYDELVISLPSSRVSFAPIEAQSSNTIFYSRQKKAGVGTYSLRRGEMAISSDEFPYPEGTEIGRVLRFTIEGNGEISVGN